MEEVNESTVNAEQVETVTPQETEQTETTNNESSEAVDTQVETKPVQDAETNAKYADIRRKAESEARDKTIAEMGMEWNGQPITTYNQYQQALKEQAEQKRQQELVDNGIDPSIFNKYIEENPTVKKASEIIAQQEKQQKMLDDYNAFEAEYPGVDIKTVPQEVWDKVNQGKSLVDSYAIFRSKELETKLKAFETNKANSESSTGSVTGNGNADKALTPEMVEKMTDKERMARWQEVKQVYNMK